MKRTNRGYELAREDLLMAVFIDRALERALRFGATDDWDTELVTLDHVNRLLESDVVLDLQSSDFEGLVLDLRNAVISVGLVRGVGRKPQVVIDVQAASRQAARLEMARLKELLPEAEAESGGSGRREPIGFVLSRRS